MAKRRTPDTIEDALVQAAGYVGMARLATWIGKSEDMVRKCADPDKDQQLHLRQAHEIDRQLALAGYPQPFAELTAWLAGRNATAADQLAQALADHEQTRPLAEAVRVVREAAALVEGVEQAEADGVYTRAEIDDLVDQLLALQKRLAPLRRALTAKVPR